MPVGLKGKGAGRKIRVDGETPPISSKRSHDYIEISGSGGEVGRIPSERW